MYGEVDCLLVAHVLYLDWSVCAVASQILSQMNQLDEATRSQL